MPSAWTQNFYHTVFSTKQRAMLITPECESHLYPFIGGIGPRLTNIERALVWSDWRRHHQARARTVKFRARSRRRSMA
jgi:hypothetical protein